MQDLSVNEDLDTKTPTNHNNEVVLEPKVDLKTTKSDKIPCPNCGKVLAKTSMRKHLLICQKATQPETIEVVAEESALRSSVPEPLPSEPEKLPMPKFKAKAKSKPKPRVPQETTETVVEQTPSKSSTDDLRTILLRAKQDRDTERKTYLTRMMTSALPK